MAHRVVVLVLDGVVPFDLGTVTQLFRTATTDEDRPCYEVVVTTRDGGSIQTNSGFSVTPDAPPSVIETADTLVIPGIGGHYLRVGWSVDPVVLAMVRDAASRGVRLVSICTGAFVLAAAGLLDDRPAATHWFHADRFRSWFPKVWLDSDVLFVDDGDILTSAGVGAGIDLCLHVIRQDFGSEVANQAARMCVVPPFREGGQAQFISRPVPDSPSESTSATRAWMSEHLGERLSLRQLAAHSRMSVRTFTRRFREETGLSPGAWLLSQRVGLARDLLENSDRSVDRIARDAGFGSGAALRSHFRAVVGVSPLAYRRTFAA